MLQANALHNARSIRLSSATCIVRQSGTRDWPRQCVGLTMLVVYSIRFLGGVNSVMLVKTGGSDGRALVVRKCDR